MEDTYIAKVVAPSKPYKLDDGGNSWIADVVYKKDDFYYTRKMLSPSIKHGPLVLGEEIIVTYNENDEIASDNMVKVYNNPTAYKIIKEEQKIKTEFEEKQVEEDEIPVLNSIANFIHAIIMLLNFAIFGILLYGLIKIFVK